MKKNISSPILSVRGNNIQQNAKKMQGFDKMGTIQSFVGRVEKIKKKPQKESLQDTYVSGLQDQIHYLELQLKLLKDKQVAKHSQVDQLQTFFGDGIPINENILAMKNGFNNYKSMIDKKIGDLEVEKKQREGLIISLQKKVSEMCKAIQEKELSYKKSLTEKSEATHSKTETETKLKHQIEVEEDRLRKIKSDNRKLNQRIGTMQRSRQILLLGILKSENNKMNKLNKLRESIQEKQKELNGLCKKYEDLKKQQEEQIYVIQIQEDNIRLKKKIISLQKELNSLHIKAEEKKMQLQAKLKDRQKEIFAKIEMQKRVDGVNEAIYKENNMSVEQLQRIGRERQSKILEAIIEKNKKLSKYVEYYGDLQTKVEDSLYSFGQRKPELKRELQLYQNQVKILQNDLEMEIERQRNLYSQLSRFNSKNEHIKEIVPGMIEQIKRSEEKIRLYQIERQRLQQQIKVKQKQVELTQIIKCLSLEEGQICNSTNSSLQDRLIDFMRNWEQINRSS